MGRSCLANGRAEFEKLALGPWASRRRSELLELLDRVDPSVEELTTAAEQEVKQHVRFAVNERVALQ